MSATWAFEFLPCRIWQFMAGILAFYFGQIFPLKNDLQIEKQALLVETNKKACNVVFSSANYLLIFLLISTFWFKLFYKFVNVFVIAGTSTLLYLGSLSESNRLLSNFVLVWIGDLSYSIYLVHWPVIQVFRYLSVSLEFDVVRKLLEFGVEKVGIFGCFLTFDHFLNQKIVIAKSLGL
jgi:peptidoglycan/LPS O-acetylase OafA/YrhL